LDIWIGRVDNEVVPSMPILLTGGAFVGLLYGLFGVGSAFATPLLALLGVPGVIAVTAPLPGIMPGSFAGAWGYARRERVDWTTARRAALVAAVLWEIAKIAFGFLTRTLGIFSAYGALAFAAGLLTWIYVTAAIILLGAEVVKDHDA